ncbi:olfactory receptor 1F1-like [Erythrolamprus reginae]|uniref:olfactory receptor 1F1-like n=1 Tax=Erythrolamprus reginae TaxID=121349 RepID=UPI00396C4551
MTNQSQPDNSEITLLMISGRPEYQRLLFLLFLSIYLLTLLGNFLIVLLIRLDNHLLQAPMYFFLCHLSLADVIFVSTTVPKILTNLMSQTRTITFDECMMQMYFFLTSGNTDNFLLACMAYDRYVAVCHPLHYVTMMSHACCLCLVSGSWIISGLHSLLYTLLISRLSFCTSMEIPYLFCDVYPLLEFSCSNTRHMKVLAQTEGVVDLLGPLAVIVISYALIFSTIMKIPSTAGKCKAVSTCGSHLAVVILFYSTISCLYFQPPSGYSAQRGTFVSLLYAVVIPMLNPFIYTLRNQEVKSAIVRLLGRKRDSLRK